MAQVLTEAHKAQRLVFSQWLIEQPDETIFQIMFDDEKWFQLNQHPNRQNTRYWSVSKPDFVFDLKNQWVSKVMAFVVIVDGTVRPVFWHQEDGKNVSVNTDQYIKAVLAVTDELPYSKLNIYWWQQDGATCHTSKRSRAVLKRMFKDRIISRFEKNVWPAHSPDLNPLDYTFWGQAMAKVWEIKPKTIPELKAVVEQYFASLTSDFIKKCVLNIKKRANLCISQKGGHFEHLMK